jgi:hypothetical protein
MSAFLVYVVLNDGTTERVSAADVDASEIAGVIDRTILPVQGGAPGWALNRRSGYTVTGDIGSKRALLTLHDETMPIAQIAICLHSRSSLPLWRQLSAGAVQNIPELPEPPAAPWCALRYDVSELALPDWIHWWAKDVAWALVENLP